MGQSASRHRPQPSPAPGNRDSTLPEASTSSTSNNGGSSSRRPTEETVSTASKRSRRSSLRRSLLGFVPRSHSSDAVRSDHQASADGTLRNRKRWHSSRRWSRANSDMRHDSPTVGGISGEVDASATENNDGMRSSTPLPTSPVLEVMPELTSEPSYSSQEGHELGEDHSPWVNRAASVSHQDPQPRDSAESNSRLPSIAELHRDIGDFLNTRSATDTHERFSPEYIAEQQPAAPEAGLTPQAPRQFPPPGTLVVVQGVVNTTDAPPAARIPSSSTLRSSRSTTPRPGSGVHPTNPLRRTASASASSVTGREGERQGTRNRLSTFMPRSRPPSAGQLADESASSHRQSGVSSDLSSSMSHDTISAEESSSAENQDGSGPENDGRPRALSPGSIDVLGTLLSVAAAATAASLFSPGLALPGPHGANNLPGSNRPMSPTPTAGLGNLPGLGNLAGVGFDPMGPGSGQAHGPAYGQRDGRDRIRNVWESVRDRLGLNSRGPDLPGLNPSSFDGGANNTSEGRMRPGELMLAEMARALNIGLGLHNDTSSPPGMPAGPLSTEGDSTPLAQTATDAAASGPVDNTDPQLPPEDSFERFLINLQADLRVALSEDGSRARNEQDNVPSASSAAPTSSEDAEPVAGPSSLVNSSQTPASEESALPASGEGSQAKNDDEPPALVDVDDSDAEFDEDEDHDTHEGEDQDGAPSSPRAPTPMPGAFPFGGDHRHGADGEHRPPGVNLWRLYRFQPIPAAQTQGHAASTSLRASSTATAPAGSVPTSNPEVSGTASTPHLSSTTTHSTQDASASGSVSGSLPTTTPDPNTNVVVPVIVVGLQSVDMIRNYDNAHAQDNVHPPDDIGTSESDSGSFDDWRHANSMGSMSGPSTGQPRGRSWQSRAANALRTFRPGRRGGSHGARANDATGARTFLIYVIGGYYPPNHHMVTGSDSLDSYEALWELAELLGQVKPPVATREDIDNSGLQIIKSVDLQRYEQEGRVANNCTERCLICLDDYSSEDDLRLMSCKHAFHKDCVDKWLQVGRNNCPACRSKGVSTPGDSSP